MSVRIVAGKAKGQRLASPRGGDLRPTSGRVRGAIFSMLGLERLQGARVLDLYAGTGALGMEAISRGAAWVDFVEGNQRQAMRIRSNIEAIGMSQQASVHCARVERALDSLPGGYDLVLADPPYDLKSLEALMTRLGERPPINERGLLVVEHSCRTVLRDTYASLRRIKDRRYGDTCVSIYALGGADG